jgi:hypothetical protein
MENLTDKSSEIIKAALTKAEEQSNAQGMYHLFLLARRELTTSTPLASYFRSLGRPHRPVFHTTTYDTTYCHRHHQR